MLKELDEVGKKYQTKHELNGNWLYEIRWCNGFADGGHPKVQPILAYYAEYQRGNVDE
ncbi:hypothetical protein KIN20_037546 [Parelaphostrongylus tenuis]|uniref:Uncharacterized protein n=1 Tax=Parelaphostrongylus tenuis TaxID=148309 RepID=A0AAD5WM55_PARTN|nr:hypothetical protein KIN20_037546 [Parelaphostrongylus tenuis]